MRSARRRADSGSNASFTERGRTLTRLRAAEASRADAVRERLIGERVDNRRAVGRCRDGAAGGRVATGWLRRARGRVVSAARLPAGGAAWRGHEPASADRRGATIMRGTTAHRGRLGDRRALAAMLAAAMGACGNDAPCNHVINDVARVRGLPGHRRRAQLLDQVTYSNKNKRCKVENCGDCNGPIPTPTATPAGLSPDPPGRGSGRGGAVVDPR